MAGLQAIPRCVEEITTDWLNTVLEPHLKGGRVRSSLSTAFSDPGQNAEVADVTLEYEGPNDLPTRMIAKLASRTPAIREVCRTHDMYGREVAFYNSFAGDGLPLARCFHAQHEPESQDMVLLLEHLSPSLTPSYGITVDQVRMAARRAAIFHAHWWNDPWLKDQAALVQLDDMGGWLTFLEASVAAFPIVRSLVGAECEASIHAITFWQANLDNVLAHLKTRPFALQHSDYYGKQIFFPHNGQGQFAIIDWQFPSVGPAAWDVARLMSMGLDTSIRRTIEMDLVTEYVDALSAEGVCGYDADQCRIDLALGVVYSQMLNFISMLTTGPSLADMECRKHGLDWKDVWLLRGNAMVEEFNSADVLRGL